MPRTRITQEEIEATGRAIRDWQARLPMPIVGDSDTFESRVQWASARRRLRSIAQEPQDWTKRQVRTAGSCQRCVASNRYVYVSGTSRFCKACLQAAWKVARG